MKRNTPQENSFTEILLYNTPNGSVKVEIYLQNETVWLTQQKIADLFGVQRPAVTKHLKNIFDSGELQEDSVSSILEHTAADEKKYPTQFYNRGVSCGHHHPHAATSNHSSTLLHSSFSTALKKNSLASGL